MPVIVFVYVNDSSTIRMLDGIQATVIICCFRLLAAVWWGYLVRKSQLK